MVTKIILFCFQSKSNFHKFSSSPALLVPLDSHGIPWLCLGLTLFLLLVCKSSESNSKLKQVIGVAPPTLPHPQPSVVFPLFWKAFTTGM